jgi:hypothetical protein
MHLSTNEIFRVRLKDRSGYMNPIHRGNSERESDPLANYYFSYDDALARITRFTHLMNDKIEDWEIVTLTQMMSEDPALKDQIEKHSNNHPQSNPNHISREPLHLIQQNKQLQNALRELALGTPQVDTMTLDEFDVLMNTFRSLSCLDWEERKDAQKQWRTAFVQHQKGSPTFVRSLLEFEDVAKNVSEETSPTTPSFDATAYREEILDLLTSDEAKKMWFTNTVALDIFWSLDNVKRFPLRLTKAYIEAFLRAEPELSVKSRDILKRVKAVADNRLVLDVKSAMKSTAEENFYDSDEDDEEEDNGMNNLLLFSGTTAREKKFDMTRKEALLILFALVWSQELQNESIEEKEIGERVNWQRALLQAIYQHTTRVNRCPPGSKISVLEATKNEENDDNDNNPTSDLLKSLCQRYEADPISALRETSRRYLLFRYGNRDATISRYRLCEEEKTDNFGIEFPDLCYVFVTEVEIVYHQSPWVRYKVDEEEDKVIFKVKTGTASVPISSYNFSRAGKGGPEIENDENTCQKKDVKLLTKTISIVNGEKKACKWIQVETENYVTVHDIRVYGKAVLLM